MQYPPTLWSGYCFLRQKNLSKPHIFTILASQIKKQTMKQILFSVFLLLGCISLSCAQKAKTDKGYKVDEKSVEKTIKFLASDELKGRDSGSEGAEMAA
jgi:hypothetical protein